MRKLQIAITSLLIISAFIAGRYSAIFWSNSTNERQLIISQELHDWAIDDNAHDTKPVSITLFIQNISNKNLNGEAKFEISLDSSGLEKSFMDSVIKLLGEENISKDSEANLGRLNAIKAYLQRGKKLPEGMEFEPLANTASENYSTIVTQNINIGAGESKKIELEVMIPPSSRGYLLKVEQK